MSQSTFKPVNRLEEILVAASTDPGARPEFYRQLLESDLFLLTPNTPNNEGRTTLKEETNVSFINLNGANGPFLPIFTSREQLQEVVNQLKENFGFLAIAGKNLFPILTQHPQTAVLNPGAPYGKELLADEIKRIADGSILKAESKVVEKATQILIGQPAKYPNGLVAALSRLFEKNECVQSAYLAQIHNPASGEPPHLMIGIQANGDFKKLVGEAAMVAQGSLGQGELADFIQVGGGTGSLDSYFKNSTKPFYQATKNKPFWKVW